jgi:hypothetical protein
MCASVCLFGFSRHGRCACLRCVRVILSQCGIVAALHLGITTANAATTIPNLRDALLVVAPLLTSLTTRGVFCGTSGRVTSSLDSVAVFVAPGALWFGVFCFLAARLLTLRDAAAVANTCSTLACIFVGRDVER